MNNLEVLLLFGGAYLMSLAIAILPNILAFPFFVGGGGFFAMSLSYHYGRVPRIAEAEE